jgi:hypothetical protein
VSSRYVKYATGNESIEEIYGYGEDRLKKLTDLKTEWDPDGRFSHYHPFTDEYILCLPMNQFWLWELLFGTTPYLV